MEKPQHMKETPPSSAPVHQREPAAMSVRGAAIWAMSAQYIGFVIQFTSSVLISRFFLTPAEVGIFSIAMAAALFVATFQDFGLSKYIAALPIVSDDDKQRASTVSLLFSFVISAIIAISAWPLSSFYGHESLAPLLVIIAASYLFMPLSIVPLALMGRRMQFHHHFVVNVASVFVQACVALGLAWLGYSAFSLAWATLAAAITRGLLAQWFQPTLPWPLKMDNLGAILNFGGKSSTLYLSGALGSRAPDLIVGKLTSLTAVGLYSRAVSLSDQFRMLIAGAIGSVFFPAFARIRDEGQPLAPAYLRVCAGYTAIVWPGMAALALTAEPIVRMLYGENWLGVAPLLTYVSIASLLMISLPLVSELPILVGQMNRLIIYNIGDTIASIVFLIIGTHYWGIEGAAASRIVYVIIWLVVHYRFMKNIVGFEDKAMASVYGKSLAVTLAAVTPILFIYYFWVPPAQFTFAMLFGSTLIGCMLWILAMKWINHPAFEEIKAIAQSVPVIRRLLSA